LQPVIPQDGFEPGVYLNMKAEVYRSDPALGSTDIKRLIVGPSEFFYHWVGNPDRGAQDESDALTLGKAFHLMVLEGRQAFDAAFACKPEGDGVLVTAEDMRGWLRCHGMYDKGLKDALADRIHSVNPNVIIADKVLAQHERDGRTVLPFESYKRVLLASQHITQNPHLARAFQGGIAEVSVFWIREGIRLKARMDYVRVIKNGLRTAVISDLKSWGRPRPGQTIEQGVTECAASYRVQASHYLEGLRYAKQHIREGLLHGADPEMPLAAIAASQAAIFAFVVLKSAGAPYASARLLSPSNPLIETSVREIDWALNEFRRHYDHFGVAMPWVSLTEPSEISVDELPRWLL
jgi:hypothetical protein